MPGRILGSQLQVLGIEPRHDIARADAIADIDQACDHLASDTKSKVGLVARAHHANEFARGVFAFERHTLHLDRALGLRRRRGVGLAASQDK